MENKKVVFITGSARGIGKTLAYGYAKKGYKVIATDILDADFNDENIEFYKMDLSSKEQIEEVFNKVKQKYNNIDILINNGAIAGFYKSIFEIEIEEFDKIISINLRGAFICSKEFLKVNDGKEFGRIINIASTRANQGEAGWEAYCASKGGMISLTQTMAVSLSDTKITVNAISPGWIENNNYEELTKEDHKQHPSGRVGKPDDILRVAMLLSDERNDFINGENIVVDGGMTKKMIYEE